MPKMTILKRKLLFKLNFNITNINFNSIVKFDSFKNKLININFNSNVKFDSFKNKYFILNMSSLTV